MGLDYLGNFRIGPWDKGWFRFVVQSGTGFLKSHSFEGELGFKTDNVMLECQNYEFKEDETSPAPNASRKGGSEENIGIE
eukprot:s380_g13.t1